MLPTPLLESVIFDLEVVPSDKGRPAKITMVGALRPGSDDALELRVSSNPLPALQSLGKL